MPVRDDVKAEPVVNHRYRCEVCLDTGWLIYGSDTESGRVKEQS